MTPLGILTLCAVFVVGFLCGTTLAVACMNVRITARMVHEHLIRDPSEEGAGPWSQH